MIIQIRGTSGSGKTTVMRKVIESFAPLESWRKVYVEGRRKPLAYTRKNLIVLGHYESACGGCDNIGSAKQIFNTIVTQFSDQGKQSRSILLCEGLLLSEDTKWTIQMEDVRTLFLTTSIEECIERVKSRRLKAGNTKPLNESNTRNRVAVIERARIKLREQGIIASRASSNQAPRIVRDWIRLHADPSKD